MGAIWTPISHSHKGKRFSDLNIFPIQSRKTFCSNIQLLNCVISDRKVSITKLNLHSNCCEKGEIFTHIVAFATLQPFLNHNENLEKNLQDGTKEWYICLYCFITSIWYICPLCGQHSDKDAFSMQSEMETRPPVQKSHLLINLKATSDNKFKSHLPQ